MDKNIKTVVNNLYRQYVDSTRYDPLIHHTQPEILENREIVYNFISYLKTDSLARLLHSNEEDMTQLIEGYRAFTDKLVLPINIVEHNKNEDYFLAIADVNSYIRNGEESMPFEFQYDKDFSTLFDKHFCDSLQLINEYEGGSPYTKEDIYEERRLRLEASLDEGYESIKKHLEHENESKELRSDSKQLLKEYLEYSFLEKKLTQYHIDFEITAKPALSIKKMFAQLLDLKKIRQQEYTSINLASQVYLNIIDRPN